MLVYTIIPGDCFGWLEDEITRLKLELLRIQAETCRRRAWASVCDAEAMHDLKTEEVKYECQSCDYVEWHRLGFGGEEFLTCPKCGRGKGTGHGLVLRWRTRRKPIFVPLHRRSNTMLRRQYGKDLTDTDLNVLRWEWEQQWNMRNKARAEVQAYYGGKETTWKANENI